MKCVANTMGFVALLMARTASYTFHSINDHDHGWPPPQLQYCTLPKCLQLKGERFSSKNNGGFSMKSYARLTGGEFTETPS